MEICGGDDFSFHFSTFLTVILFCDKLKSSLSSVKFLLILNLAFELNELHFLLAFKLIF